MMMKTDPMAKEPTAAHPIGAMVSCSMMTISKRGITDRAVSLNLRSRFTGKILHKKWLFEHTG